MSSMETAIALTDHASAPLYQISTAVQTVTRELELLRVVSGNAFNTSAFEAARVKLTEQLVPIEQIASATNEAAEKQQEHNDKMEKGTSLAGKLADKVKALVGKYANLSTVKNVLGMSDELTQTMTHLDTIVIRYNELNGTMQTTTDLSRMIYQSAQSSRTSYLGAAEAVAELGNRAQNAFSSTEEMVGFAELANKQFAIAGLSANESSAAFSQLSEAMGDGVLSGNELSGIFKQAPNLVQTLADYMGAPTEQISELASQGQITADIMKNAMFAAQDEINARFESMPMTWGQVWTMFQNGVLVAFQPVLQRINELANSGELQTCVTGVLNVLSGVGAIALEVVDTLAAGGAWIVDHWSMIAPIVYTVAAAIAILGTAVGGYKAVTAIATITQTVFNAALLACPLTWILLLVIAVVVQFYLLIYMINKATESTISATGIIMGTFALLFTNLINTFVIPVQNVFAFLANFIGNLFNDPVVAVKVLFYDMALTVIGYISSMASAVETLINKIPGVTVDITSDLDNFYNELEAAQRKIKEDSGWTEYVKKWHYLDPEAAFDKGYDWGQGIENRVKSFLVDQMIINSRRKPENMTMMEGMEDITQKSI